MLNTQRFSPSSDHEEEDYEERTITISTRTEIINGLMVIINEGEESDNDEGSSRPFNNFGRNLYNELSHTALYFEPVMDPRVEEMEI